jgi:hypothetical protein
VRPPLPLPVRTDLLHLLQVVVILDRARKLVLALVEAAARRKGVKAATRPRALREAPHMDNTRCRILFSATKSMAHTQS